jgi:tetratricopeptide (TPR) repeat protein
MPTTRRVEWFRRTTWTAAGREAFFARLARSRTRYHKAQYLRVQAYTLMQAGLKDVALQLLDLLVSEYPEESQLALAHEHRGTILGARGDVSAAIEAFAAGNEAERKYPNIHTRCSLMLALLVVEEGIVERYGDAAAAVDSYVSNNPDFLLPVDAYHVNVVHAALAKQERRDAAAKRFAERALAASEAQSGPFHRYPKIGLVGNAISKLHSRLRRWSA